MSGLLEILTANDNVQGAGAVLLQAYDAGISALADAAGVGEAVGIVDTVIGMLNPSAGSTQPSLQDLINQFTQFSTFVSNELNQLKMTTAGGQVENWAIELQKILQGPEGPLNWIPEINDWKSNPGLPLPDEGFSPSPSDCHGWARAALSLLIGGASVPPPGSPPTGYWYLPPGDLPLFQPDNPWTYLGTGHMFNQSWMFPFQAGGPFIDINPFAPVAPPLPSGVTQTPQFDLSGLNFTNNFSPAVATGVPPNITFNPPPGVPSGNAFNPTWVLQQTMAAVTYYFMLCGAVLQNFPNDGATVHDFVGTGPTDPNFLWCLSWYHDQIRAGIVCIAPPFPVDLLPIGPGDLIPATADAGISSWSVPCGLPSSAVSSDPANDQFNQGFRAYDVASQAAANAPFSQWKRPFGALCNYNGFVAGFSGPQPSVDSYPDYVFPSPGQSVTVPTTPVVGGPELSDSATAASRQWYTGFYGKYLVACLWRAKLVYNGMGLGDMWRTINKLYVMFGQPPRPGTSFGDWSLREVFRLLGSADGGSFPLPQQLLNAADLQAGATPLYSQYTVRAFLQFMNGAAPIPSAPVRSLRAVLQA
jgi:hypothetical protein